MKNTKEYIATQKYLIMSPRKIRLVVALIKKMKPTEAIEKLPFVQKRAGESVSKVIKNALASARFAGVADNDLVFKEIQVGEGPRLKRGKAASRGRWHPRKRRMSHIRVVLTTVKSQNDKNLPEVEEKKNKVKSETKIETKGVKKNVTKS